MYVNSLFVRASLKIVLVLGVTFFPVAATSLQVQKLIETLDEVSDFTRYNQRPIQTSSRAEALDLLKSHCQSIIDYHKDLENI